MRYKFPKNLILAVNYYSKYTINKILLQYEFNISNFLQNCSVKINNNNFNTDKIGVKTTYILKITGERN